MKRLSRTIIAAIAGCALATGALAQEELLYVEVTKLLASDGGFVDQFGDTLAIDGDTLVIGGDDIGVGGAYVYQRNHGGSNTWGEVVKLIAPDQSDNFGRSVEIQGDVIAVGSTDVDQSGAVYFFERNVGGLGNWGFTAKLQAPDGPISGQAFAYPTLDGNRLLVGASDDEDGGGFATGAVYVFERDELAPQDSEFENFGGAAYIFEKEGAIWVEKKKLTAPVPESDGKFGEGLAMEGDIIAVGHPGEGNNFGAVYVYGRDTGGQGNWGLEATLNPSDIGGLFGTSVDLDQGTLVIGADVSGPDTDDAGAVYVFEEDRAGSWTELARLEASDRTEFQRFGDTVGISGGTVVAGADQDDDTGLNSGAAYVFQAVVHPLVTITGSCPGEITLKLSGATPSGTVFVAYATSEGTTILPGGACAGAELALEAGQFLVRFAADSSGAEITTAVAPEGACGLYLQVVDGLTCGVGPVAQVP